VHDTAEILPEQMHCNQRVGFNCRSTERSNTD